MTSLTAAEEGWIDLYHHAEWRMVSDAAFVLTALGIMHEVQQLQGRWVLFVPASLAGRAGSELDAYWRENRLVRHRPPETAPVDSGLSGVLGFLLVIWALPWLEFRFLEDWRGAGVLAAEAVRSGDWWRTVTALTLHADLGHIAGNSLFGAVFGALAGRQLGSGIAWLLILLAAAAGNGLNALLQPAAFTSLGASTATFAAVGLLAAVVWRRGYYRNWSWQRSLAPLFAAVALFAFTGIGDENTDIAAHALGIGAGILVGLLAAGIPRAWLVRRGQWLAGSLALIIVTGCWWLAL